MGGAALKRTCAAASFCLVAVGVAFSIRKEPGDLTSRDRTVQSDICIFGGTPAGLAAAVQARRMGRTAVVVEPTRHLGGMTTGGLGATDIGNKDAIGGISREFYRRVARHYSKDSAWRFETSREYFAGQGKTQPSDVDLTSPDATMWTFEPHVASRIFEEMIDEAGAGVYLEKRLTAVKEAGRRIGEIVSEDGTVFRAKMFIDASYEGDLMAAAGVSYRVGREGNTKYGETLNGIRGETPKHQFLIPVDPFVKQGEPASGFLPFIQPGGLGRPGDGDRRVQAYNYRLCFTMNPDNRLEVAPPPDYSPEKYELLARYLEALFAAGEKPTLSQFWNPVRMPNLKTDINNNGAFSTDFLGASWEYPEADCDKRERLAKVHENYIRGFLHFLATSPRVPETMRAEMREWGPCRDEFTDNAGWPTQLYVREARRLVSDYVMTEKNCRGREVIADSVGLAAYNMDSHNVRRLERSGHAENEGDVQVAPMAPYPISYRAIIPRASECENLVVPVCLSATHIAYGSIRMEPVFMILGQSAATAASLAIEKEIPLQKLNYAALRSRLLKDGQILEWRTGRSLKRRVDCTAFVMRRGGAALLARNLDSPAAGGYLFVNKRGVMKEAFGAGSARALSWTSRYGSVTFNQFGREFPLAGMNEAGLVIEGLGGPATYPPADRRPAVNELQWIQYQLDTCGSVKDALKSDRAMRISRLFLNLHYLIADRKGAAAVVEFEAGKMRAFRRGELPVPVLTSSGYEESIRGLGLRSDSEEERAVRERTPSDERFARVARALDEYIWLGQSPIVDQAFAVLRSVERPDTRWSAVYSPRSRRLFLKTRVHRRYKFLSLDSLDFSCGSSSLMIPVDTDAAGNLSRSFAIYDAAKNCLLLETTIRQLRQSGGFAPGLPDGTIRRMSDYPLTCRCR
jgi:penicillin V acylase-like amidase (Ntn superfamily)